MWKYIIWIEYEWSETCTNFPVLYIPLCYLIREGNAIWVHTLLYQGCMYNGPYVHCRHTMCDIWNPIRKECQILKQIQRGKSVLKAYGRAAKGNGMREVRNMSFPEKPWISWVLIHYHHATCLGFYIALGLGKESLKHIRCSYLVHTAQFTA